MSGINGMHTLLNRKLLSHLSEPLVPWGSVHHDVRGCHYYQDHLVVWIPLCKRLMELRDANWLEMGNDTVREIFYVLKLLEQRQLDGWVDRAGLDSVMRLVLKRYTFDTPWRHSYMHPLPIRTAAKMIDWGIGMNSRCRILFGPNMSAHNAALLKMLIQAGWREWKGPQGTMFLSLTAPISTECAEFVVWFLDSYPQWHKEVLADLDFEFFTQHPLLMKVATRLIREYANIGLKVFEGRGLNGAACPLTTSPFKIFGKKSKGFRHLMEGNLLVTLMRWQRGAEALELMRALLDAGMDPDWRNTKQQTFLHCCLHPGITHLLLERGADPLALDVNGHSPLVTLMSTDAHGTLMTRDADCSVMENTHTLICTLLRGSVFGLLVPLSDLDAVERVCRRVKPWAMSFSREILFSQVQRILMFQTEQAGQCMERAWDILQIQTRPSDLLDLVKAYATPCRRLLQSSETLI
jgi:hypothetical protein